ncbi:SDR family oxidoreductase [Actinomadura oligospora]|uniref:SDR family oxidoreductase n=1 Tax=Actinomadura oligospora TaxID=111804 RepID=UPI000479421B|nr:SDR family oxidoreductase [Actinomadura oligospora]
MNIVIAGGHGQIALRLARTLSARGDAVLSLIRNPEQVDDVRETGAGPVIADLENLEPDDLVDQLTGCDAVVFAAGAGPKSGVARKDTVDRGASALMAEAAGRAGVRRFVQISSMGAGSPVSGGDDAWAAYINAKTAAEDDLRRRDLDWVILRPGRLTNDPGTGRVTLAEPEVGRGDVTRDDVATVIAALLAEPKVNRTTLELVNGDVPIAEAVAKLV